MIEFAAGFVIGLTVTTVIMKIVEYKEKKGRWLRWEKNLH